MTRDDIQKLLGGYSTGTLTPEEQQALFAAALDDQDLFDALAKEQALRDLLRDPAARAHVLAALDERPEPWWRRATRWALRPAGVGAMAACLAAVGGYAIWHARQMRAPEAPVLTAESDRAPVAPAPQAPEQAPAAKPTPERRAIREAVRPPATAVPAPVAAPAAAAPPPPVNQSRQLEALRGPFQQSDSASQQQTVTVTGSTPAVQTQAAAPRDFAALPAPKGQLAELPLNSGSALPMSRPEVKWSALRREADGRLSSVEAGRIRAGDAIVLRLEPYADGYLSVAERLPGLAAPRTLVAATRVEGGKPLDTPALTLARPGSLELFVQFTARAGGMIVGHIRDAAGSAVGKTTVVVTNRDTNRTARVQSDDTGYFETAGLPPGAYTVTAEAPGFKKATRSTELLAEDRRAVDIALEVGAITESVEVRAAGERPAVKGKPEAAAKDTSAPQPAGQTITLRYR